MKLAERIRIEKVETLANDWSTLKKTTLADQQTRLASDKTSYESRLTSQFTAMNTAVSAYKSTQSYLTQQIAQWDKSS